MYSIAQPTPFSVLTDEQWQHLLQDAHLLSVHEVFAAVPDPRGKQGVALRFAVHLDLFGSGIALQL